MATGSLDSNIIEAIDNANHFTHGTGSLPPLVSTRQKVLKRFFRHRFAIIGLALLAVMYFSIIFAEFLAPYGESSAERAKPYAPPTRIHFFHNGEFVGPFIYNFEEVFDNKELISKRLYDKKTPYKIKLFSKGESYKFLGFIPCDRHLFGVDAPARIYLWGGDLQGRDVFSRIFYGGRVSLTVGLLAIMISFPLGLIIGGISGYFGGWTDTIIMRFVEAIITFPTLYLLLTLSATLPKGLTSLQRYIFIIVILSFVGWASQARIYRGQVLSLKQMEYVEASRAIGVPHILIIIRHIIPQMASWIIISATISIPSYTLGEAALSFLSLGIQDPQSSWGLMLQEARDLTAIQTRPWLLIPGFAIVATVFAFSFFGDGLRDAFDAKKQI